MTKNTRSKRDVVLAWLEKHYRADLTLSEIAQGAGCGIETARRYLAEHRRTVRADVAVDAVDIGDEDDVDDNVSVPRLYLQTLEALRDQVLEAQRLRRVLEAR